MGRGRREQEREMERRQGLGLKPHVSNDFSVATRWSLSVAQWAKHETIYCTMEKAGPLARAATPPEIAATYSR